MKTIEEAAMDYLEDIAPSNPDFDFSILESEYEAFKAGVEFAQEWISVEKELPDGGITVLIKDKNNMIGMACRRFGDWDYKFKNTITHWRPITKK